MNRSIIYNALVAQLQTLTSAPYNYKIPTLELGLDNAANVVLQPAIFVAPTREKSEAKMGLPNKWTLQVELWVYVKKSGNQNGVQNLIPLLDIIDKLLSPQTQQRGPGYYVNDLGVPGSVSRCSINGETEIFGGYADDQTVARIPIEIVTAG